MNQFGASIDFYGIAEVGDRDVYDEACSTKGGNRISMRSCWLHCAAARAALAPDRGGQMGESGVLDRPSLGLRIEGGAIGGVGSPRYERCDGMVFFF